jgi:CrcB protein
MRDHGVEVRTDAGVDARAVLPRSSTRPRRWDVTVAIAVGGVLGALVRSSVSAAWPHAPGAFPWATFSINVAGCALIGALMAVVTEVVGRPHRLARPFLGVGVLGGFTTFSTYTVDIQRLITDGHPLVALADLFGTLGAALIAVQVGIVAVRLFTRPRTRR